MDATFWKERWRKGKTGFHQKQVNQHLERYYPLLGIGAGEPVFVPLCGKSLDMLWLAERGHPVLGIEFSAIAARSFFTDNNLEASEQREERFTRICSANVEILVGDFFDIVPEDLHGAAVAYDRAALIALPPELRKRYAIRMAELLPTGARALLITVVYRQADMQGPPFSVPEQEVRELFGQTFHVQLLSTEDVLAHNERFRERGLNELEEQVVLLTRV